MSDADQLEESLFEAALRLPAGERAAYLAKTCAGNPELRRRVDVLLAAFERAGGFMNDPAVAPPTRTGTLAPSEKPGDRIGRYKLLEQIGEGGCGVVYVAEQEEPVRRRVALKVIKLGMDTKAVIARFEAERQALAMMDHPHIAKVLDAGATDAGRPYFVMELVRGVRITQFCAEHRLPTEERLKIFIQVCQAVQHAHQKGVIHRDLKPSNILVTMLDGRPIPKVIDFGIAKATAGRLTDQTVYTAFEQFLGTPAYMSPEQAEMSVVDIDTRSDIYSLGVLLYELLTGSTPFDQNELLAEGLNAMRRTIREKEPLKPSTRLTQQLSSKSKPAGAASELDPATLHRLLQELRGELDWIVMKCLEKDRARRYETANGLATDISRYLSNEPVVARPPSRVYRFQKSVQRNKLAYGAASAVIVALVIGLTVSMALFFRAQAEKKKAQVETTKSQQVARFLTDMLEGVSPSVAQGRDTTILREILDKTAERVGKELTKQPDVEVDLRNVLGQTYRSIGAYEEAAAMLRQAVAVARRQFGNDHKVIATSLYALGATLISLGKLQESEAALREAEKIIISIGETNTLEMAHILQGLAVNSYLNEKMDEAGDRFQGAVSILTGLFGKEHGEVAATLKDLGNTRANQGRLEEAESLLQEALLIQQKVLHPLHPYLADALADLAAILDQRGNRSRSEELYRQALAIREKIYGGEHGKIALLLYNMTDLLHQTGRLDEAETTARKALAMYRKLAQGEPDTIEGRCLRNLALILADKGKMEEAEETAREGVALRISQFGNESAEVAHGQHALAHILQKRNKLTEAEETARQAVALWLKKRPNGTSTFVTFITLGDILFEQKRYADAEGPLREGIQGLEPRKATLTLSENKRLKHALERMAQVCEATNRPDEATKWKQKRGAFDASKQ